MKTFDYRRCALVLKRDILGNGKKYLRGLGGVFLACFIVEALFFYAPSRFGVSDDFEGEQEMLHLLSRVAGCSVMMLSLFILVGAGQLFDLLKTKEGRIAFLTLPATRAEKYVARWVVSVVLWPAAFLVAFVAADLLRMLVFPLLGHAFPSAIPRFFSKLAEIGSELSDVVPWLAPSFEQMAERWLVLLLCLSWHAVYLLGSSFFRKQAFLLTSLTGILLLTLAGFVLAAVPPAHLPLVSVSSSVAAFCVADVILFCFVVFCYWLSFRLFSRVQVIGNKWFNV